MWPGSVDINKQNTDGSKWGAGNSTTSDSNPWHGKDSMTSGWGSVNQSPVPNAGTEGWSNSINQQLQQSNANGPMLPQQVESRTLSNFSSNNLSIQQSANVSSAWGNSSNIGPTGAWSRGNPMTTNQVATTSAPNQPPGMGGPSSWAEAVASKQPSNNSSSGLGGISLSISSSTSTTVSSSQPIQPTSEESKVLVKKTQEEIIAMAINSNEGWGNTVIRQDTAWIIDDPPAPTETSHKDSHLEHDQQSTAALTSKQIITGTAIWESFKASQKPAEITTPWDTGKVTSVVANGPCTEMLNNSQPSSFRQPVLDNKSTLPSVNWPIQASVNSNPTTSTMNWTLAGSVVGPSPSDVSWSDSSITTSNSLKKEEDRPMWGTPSTTEVGSKSSTDLGLVCWERNSMPLHQSSSASSWIEETASTGLDLVNSGVGSSWNEEKSNSNALNEIDDGTSLWGDPGQNKTQHSAWRPGSVLPNKGSGNNLRKSESEVFNSSQATNLLGLKLNYGMDELSRTWNSSVAPPSTESSGWGSSDVKDNAWMGWLVQNQRLKPPFRGSGDITDWSALANSRALFENKGQQPLPRSLLLQKLTSLGFKKEEAQAALISNNMNYDDAMMLMKNRGGSLALDHTLLSSSIPSVPGRFISNSSRSLSSGMEDVLDNAALDLINLSNLSLNSNNNLNGVTSSLVNQLRGGANNIALHQFASNLGNANLDFSALLNSGAVLPQLQASKSLGPLASQQHNRSMPSLPQQQPHFMNQLLQCVQSAVQLGLLPPQAINQHTLMNPQFISNVQMLLKLHENHQKLLLQSMQQVPPPSHSSGLVMSQQQQQQQQLLECTTLQQHIETLKQQLLHMAITVSTSVSQPSTSSAVAPSSRLISQWKIADNSTNSIVNNDVNRLQHSSSLLESNDSNLLATTSNTWLPISSSSGSSWMTGGDNNTVNNITSVSNDQKSAASSTQTSSLSESNSGPVAVAHLDIEEFVPGKPWQGPGTKNVEDDPYLTPGSITRNSISTVKDTHASSNLGKSNNYPSLSNTSTSSITSSVGSSFDQRIPPFPSSKLGSQWVAPDSRSSDLWNAHPFSSSKSGASQWNAINRSISWASGDRPDNVSSSTTAISSNWSMSSAPSNWLLIKSIPQVDNNSLQGLCLQNGHLISFIPNFHQGQALVGFNRLEDAVKAHHSMGPCRLANSAIKAEFISESEVSQMAARMQQQQQLANSVSGFQQNNNGLMGTVGGVAGLMGGSGLLGNGPAFFGKLPLSVPPGGDPSMLAGMRAPHHWSGGLSGAAGGGMMGHLWNNQTSPASQQSLWGSGVNLEDHDHSVFLPGDLLGSQ